MDHADIGPDGKVYKLLPKQDHAARVFVEKGCKSTAYRAAYNTKAMKPETVNRKAAELFDLGKMAARVKELQAKAQVRHKTTVDTITAKLAKAYDMGEKTEKSGAMTQAALGEAKLHGLLVDKHQDVTPPADLSDQQIEAELAAIREELDQLGTRH